MGVLDRLFKKPWQRVACTFAVQEYGAGGGRGWSTITDPTGEPPTIAQCSEVFKPGHHYRVIARAVEGEKAGTYVGTVWKHYDPLPGGMPQPKPKAKEREPKQPMAVEEMMEQYVEKVVRIIEPISKFAEALNTIRDSLFPAPAEGAAPPPTPAQTGYQIPPPQFDGSLPVYLHPYVIRTIGEEVRGVIDYGASRIEGVLGKRGEEVVEEDVEEPLLPSLLPPEAPVEEVLEEIPPEGYVEEIPLEEPPLEVPIEAPIDDQEPLREEPEEIPTEKPPEEPPPLERVPTEEIPPEEVPVEAPPEPPLEEPPPEPLREEPETVPALIEAKEEPEVKKKKKEKEKS